jgi:SAM-dependent methyltransferase
VTDPGFGQRQVEAWSNPPVDDVGYLPAEAMLKMSDEQLLTLADTMRRSRYDGERNHGNRWRDVMGLDELTGLDVLDFGCGVGMEAVELGRRNRVGLADISGLNLEVAGRLLYLSGYRDPLTYHLVQTEPPYIDAADGSYDVFYASGVLHHIPWARQIMEHAHALLRPGGQCRLMLYSDQGWREATGTEPPADVTTDRSFRRFIAFFDSVGEYSDWYSEARLVERFGDLFTVERCEYLTATGRFLGAVLRRKDSPDGL